jgi:hypothetical protein
VERSHTQAAPRRRAKIWRNAKGGLQFEMTYEAEEASLNTWIEAVEAQWARLDAAVQQMEENAEIGNE